MDAVTGAMFYYFLVDTDGGPYAQSVLATNDPDRQIGELIALDDGTRVRVRRIETRVDAESAGRGFDGVLVVEPDPHG